MVVHLENFVAIRTPHPRVSWRPHGEFAAEDPEGAVELDYRDLLSAANDAFFHREHSLALKLYLQLRQKILVQSHPELPYAPGILDHLQLDATLIEPSRLVELSRRILLQTDPGGPVTLPADNGRLFTEREVQVSQTLAPFSELRLDPQLMSLDKASSLRAEARQLVISGETDRAVRLYAQQVKQATGTGDVRLAADTLAETGAVLATYAADLDGTLHRRAADRFSEAAELYRTLGDTEAHDAMTTNLKQLANPTRTESRPVDGPVRLPTPLTDQVYLIPEAGRSRASAAIISGSATVVAEARSVGLLAADGPTVLSLEAARWSDAVTSTLFDRRLTATTLEELRGWDVLTTTFVAYIPHQFFSVLPIAIADAYQATGQYSQAVATYTGVLTYPYLNAAIEGADPGWERRSHLDGTGAHHQVRTRTDTGWVVEQTKLKSVRGHEVAVIDGYPAAGPAFDATVPAGTARHDKHYDFAGRLVRETLFGGPEVRHVHDGAVTRFYDPDATAALLLDPATTPSRSSRADAWGRLVAVTEHTGAATPTERRAYDGTGVLVSLTDATGQVSLASVLDGWGNRIRVDSTDAGTTTFVFDADNNEVLRTDADGREVRSERDQHGRLVQVLHDAEPQEELTYDTGSGDNLVGRLARVVGPFGTASYSYDPDGNATRLGRTFTGDPTTYVVGFSYDSQAKVRSVTYPDGHRIDYAYDPQGLLRGISGVVEEIDYGPHGQRVRMRFANGVQTTRDHRPGDHLLRELRTETVAARPGGHTVGTRLQHLVYDLDAVGRVRAAADLSDVTGKIRNSQTFGYDERNRLAFATGTRSGGAAYRFDYAYDAGGNLVSGETFAGMVHGRDGDDPAHPNRLRRRGSSATPEYEYDASGNLTRDPELGQLSYDARHRLVRVTRPGGEVVDFVYDHHDRRVTTRVTVGAVTKVRHEVEGVFVVDDAGTTTVVFDEDRRLALLPSTGDGLIYHLDRLGNINVVSSLTTGAFTGGNEYTPWGVLTSSTVIQPAYAWGGALLTDGLDIVLLGQRWYRPALGRFLTADAYLLVHQDKIPGLHGATNLYLYALDNPANYSDPTGRLAFLVILLVAAIVGAVIGAIGAGINGVETWDEFLLWVVGGAIGGMLAGVAWAGVIVGVAALFGAGVAFSAAAMAGLIIFAAAGLLGAIATPLLDKSNSPVAWFFSFLIKWAQSPLTTTVGLVAAAVVKISGGNVDFRRGMLFIEVGAGGGALTLGAVAWTQSGRFDANGNVPDNLARHESVHSRTVAAIGELGFYFTYVVVGGIWGVAQGGAWNNLDSNGCGNPFEKTAHTFTNDPGTAVSAGSC